MFDRLWDALHKPSTSPEETMDIVNTADCGLGQRSTTTHNHGTLNYRKFPTIKSGSTPLMLAILANRPDIAAKFLAVGAEVDAKECKGLTALHVAAAIRSSVCIKFLSDYGADINSVDKKGATPLHVAVEWQDRPSQKALLGEGADVRAAYPKLSFFGEYWVMFTPLHEAALLRVRDDYEIVAALIRSGADPNFAVATPTSSFNLEGRPGLDRAESFTPLHVAAGNGSTTLKQLLVEGANPNAKTELGRTPLHLAVQYYNRDIEALVASGANVNAETKSGHTALHYAILTNSYSDAELLITNGADVNAQLANGQTPLHLAAQSGDNYLITSLIDGGAYVEATNKDNLTPLCVAVLHNNIKNVEYLIDKGANVEGKHSGVSPLRIATKSGHIDCILLLLAKGANPPSSC